MRVNVVVHEPKLLDSLVRNPPGHVIPHLSLQGTEGYKSIASSTQHSACSLESAPTCPLRPGRPASQASQAALGAKGTAGDAGGGRRGAGGGGGRSRGAELCASRHHHSRSAGPSLSSCFFFSSPDSFQDVLCPLSEMRGASRPLLVLDCVQGLPLVTGALGNQDLVS